MIRVKVPTPPVVDMAIKPMPRFGRIKAVNELMASGQLSQRFGRHLIREFRLNDEDKAFVDIVNFMLGF